MYLNLYHLYGECKEYGALQNKQNYKFTKTIAVIMITSNNWRSRPETQIIIPES